ncbi:hypothetical protein GW15_0216525 [Xanthomonas axonopodis pv. vasculorum]|uniref:ABC-2 type transporter transmembrane domain-containing protein n=3 Tax=Xanthomonas axonopodis TaxID=53413 RepID=A0A098PWI3_9XANT|nr:hypothetical protein GW15_0216525 [Xanthomonas axonopodis pv. vasculorum]
MVKVGAALTTAGIGLTILLVAQLLQTGLPSAWALLSPFILLEMTPMLLAIAWSLSALGVYLRDIGQFVGIVSSVLLFLSPIFFPAHAMPEAAKVLVYFNPLVTPIEQLRAVTIQHSPPDLVVLLPHFMLSLAAALISYSLFRRLSRGFSDVL